MVVTGDARYGGGESYADAGPDERRGLRVLKQTDLEKVAKVKQVPWHQPPQRRVCQAKR